MNQASLRKALDRAEAALAAAVEKWVMGTDPRAEAGNRAAVDVAEAKLAKLKSAAYPVNPTANTVNRGISGTVPQAKQRVLAAAASFKRADSQSDGNRHKEVRAHAREGLRIAIAEALGREPRSEELSHAVKYLRGMAWLEGHPQYKDGTAFRAVVEQIEGIIVNSRQSGVALDSVVLSQAIIVLCALMADAFKNVDLKLLKRIEALEKRT